MSFLKDFKEDLSLAVSELLPQEEKEESAIQPEEEEKTEEQPDRKEEKADKRAEKKAKKNSPQSPVGEEPVIVEEPVIAEEQDVQLSKIQDVVAQEVRIEEEKPVEDVFLAETEEIELMEAKETMDEVMMEDKQDFGTMEILSQDAQVTEEKSGIRKSGEVATITEGTRIRGDIESDGSLEILGHVTGNVTCNGKLTITGTLIGDSNADEIYADSAKVEGEINSAGAVKVGLGSVILGNVNATSAVIAGAIRGDIDVHGPVIVDTSAVVMGNIKSRSVQINNGAVIEGFCSQCYSDVSVKNFFEENKPSEQKKNK